MNSGNIKEFTSLKAYPELHLDSSFVHKMVSLNDFMGKLINDCCKTADNSTRCISSLSETYISSVDALLEGYSYCRNQCLRTYPNLPTLIDDKYIKKHKLPILFSSVGEVCIKDCKKSQLRLKNKLDAYFINQFTSNKPHGPNKMI